MTDSPAAIRPNFFVVGAAKSGTTSLASYLDQHPDIFMSKPKEPNYFAFEPGCMPPCKGPVDSSQLFDLLLKYSITSPAIYRELFAKGSGCTAVGEASVRYLYAAAAADRIARYAPAAKIIAMLRHPVDRMYSHYHMNVRRHIEPLSFRQALAAEDGRVEEGWGWDWHYRRVSLYAEQLQRYYGRFPRSQIAVVFYEHFQRDPRAALQRIFSHLGVDPQFQPDLGHRSMVGQTPRSRWLRQLIRDDNLAKRLARRVFPKAVRAGAAAWTEKANRRGVPALAAAAKAELVASFQDDIRRLARLLQQAVPW